MAKSTGIERVKVPKSEVHNRIGKVRYFDLVDGKPKWGWAIDVREKIAAKTARFLTRAEINGSGPELDTTALPEPAQGGEAQSDSDPKEAAEKAAAAARAAEEAKKAAGGEAQPQG